MFKNLFRCEILNEMLGEAEDAFFTYKSFRDKQIIKNCYYIPKTYELLNYQWKNKVRQKQDTEIRIVGIDYAFANTTGGTKNDNTFIICMSGIWEEDHFRRIVDYAEGHEASDSLGAALRAREIWELYDADVFLCDNRNGGESLFNYVTQPWSPEMGKTTYSGRGLGLYDKSFVHVVPEAKLEDLRYRTVDPKAVPAIVPFIGTPTLNSAVWVDLKRQLEANNIEFLVSAQNKQEELEDNGEYFQMSTEEWVQAMLPYGQIDELVQEAVNLKMEIRNNNISLTEPRSGTKDRIVILGYVNYIMSLFEVEYQKMAQEDYDNYENLELIY